MLPGDGMNETLSEEMQENNSARKEMRQLEGMERKRREKKDGAQGEVGGAKGSEDGSCLAYGRLS